MQRAGLVRILAVTALMAIPQMSIFLLAKPMKTKSFYKPTEAAVEGVLVRQINLAMAEVEAVQVVQAVKVLVLLAQEEIPLWKIPRKAIVLEAVERQAGQKAEARTATMPNMAEAAEGQAMPLVQVIGQVEVLFTAEAVEAEPAEITLRPKLAVHGENTRLVAAEPVARQKL